MRLNRHLAAAGFGSRRACEELIRSGRVTINGRPCVALATVVAPGDRVAVGRRPAVVQQGLTLIAYKPRGLVCTAEDEAGRPTVMSLLPRGLPRLFPVGRLDRESEGLLVLTNDGDLALRLTHPRYKVEKEYEVRLDRPFDVVHAAKLLRGFHIPGGRAKMEAVTVLRPDLLRVILCQGIKRQIRLMLYELGYEVKTLCRVRIGPLEDRRLGPGQWRELTRSELDRLGRPEPVPAGKPGAGAPGTAARRRTARPRNR
jgi:23S rRNA pseudouridine2605 synthase